MPAPPWLQANACLSSIYASSSRCVGPAGESTKSELKRLAETHKFKHVVLSVIDGKELKKFALNPEAEATVLLYSRSVIRENRPIRSGELTETVVAEIGKQAAAHFAAQ